MQLMWNFNTKVIPVTARAIGTIIKVTQKIPEQRRWNSLHQGTTEHSHTILGSS